MRQGLDKMSVLQAAVEIAEQEGYERVTLASLAKKLQIRTPSLYNHVQGLPGLKKEMALYAIRKLKEHLTEAAIGRNGEDALYSIGIAYVSFVRHHSGLYEASLGAPDPMDEEIRMESEAVVTLLLRILEAFSLRDDDAIHAVRGLRSIVHGFASLELKHGFNMDVDGDKSLRYILRTYITGLRTNNEQADNEQASS